jgi:hypothetical protein
VLLVWFASLQELEGMVQRAAAQTDPEEAEDKAKARRRAEAGGAYTGISRSLSGSLALDKDVFWFAAQSKDRFRWGRGCSTAAGCVL